MKKSLLALSIAAVVVSTSASATTIYDKDGSSLDVYGRVQGVVYSTHQAGYNSYDDSSLQATGRLGLNMRTNLTSGIDAFANMEWDAADGRDNPSFKARYAYLGVDFGAYGVFKAGRFEDAVKYVLAATDVFDDYGCNAQFGNDEKRDGIFMYSLSNNGFDLNLSFQTAQDDQITETNYFVDELMQVDHAYAASVGYTSQPVLFGPISIKAGYSRLEGQRYDTGKKFTVLDHVDTWATSLSWGNLSDGLYLGALYNERVNKALTSEEYTSTGYEAVIGYAFENGVSIRTGYNYNKYDCASLYSVEAKVVPVYLNYQVNPSFNVWTEARFDAGTDSDPEFEFDFDSNANTNYEENVFSVGVRYTF